MSKVQVLHLRPTQFAVGMREVENKVEKLRSLGHNERHEFLHAHPVPVVLAPDGDQYIIDHHHLVRAAWETGIEGIVTEIRADLAKLRPEQFWEHMKKEGWVYLHDQFGKGPHEPEFLPVDVRGLADDPFRSLAWAVREKKGFDKSPIPFCEFRWSEFFRKHFSAHPMKMGFHNAIDQAIKLCHLPEAKKLPGYIGD
jgi:hypothetical protein